MARTARHVLTGLGLDPIAAQPLHRQLYGQLRAAILAGRLRPGARIPSSRLLAAELGCARGTILLAFDQLHAEGYLRSTGGSGTFVAEEIPDDLLSVRRPAERRDDGREDRLRLSANAAALLAAPAPVAPGLGAALQIGQPALDAFPRELWAKLSAETWRGPAGRRLLAASPTGYPPLRVAIADYLRAARGLDCRPEEVIVTSGTQHALSLLVRLLLDPGDRVWLEEPGYPALPPILLAAGARSEPIPVDGEGISVATGRRIAPAARLAVVAPSHQYPLGVVMSLPRRLELLRWAEASDAWIVEDDYDSEFRYRGRPLEPLRVLDETGRVIYLGTFSKVLFPGLRLGYLVAPPKLADTIVRAFPLLEPPAATIAQATLARFIAEGHFAAHLRRVRQLYAERQAALIGAALRHLGDRIILAPEDAGMHLVGYPAADLEPGFDDLEFARDAARAGIGLSPLSRYYFGAVRRKGLLFGYAGTPPAAIEDAMARLGAMLRTRTDRGASRAAVRKA
ncbi:MAG: PLP-dependent aminotransferase family protein [Alphaproteobacteria bacterium]|nr:PLP-dependent aminotransferase family protein [Alphaproteobacteria bacterium]